MFEWIGVCCCSSLFSCICSLIATTFCLSPDGVGRRQSMTSDYTKHPKPKRLGKISPNTLDSRANRKRSAALRSGSSCDCTFEKCPAMRYRSNFSYHDDLRGYPISFQRYGNPPANKTMTRTTSPIFLPACSKICQSSFRQESNNEIVGESRDHDPVTDSEMRKRIDEYDAVFKQFKQLIEDKNKDDKKASAIVSEARVSTQEILAMIDTSTSVNPLAESLSDKSTCLGKPRKTVSSEEKVIKAINEQERFVFRKNYNDAINDDDNCRRDSPRNFFVMQSVQDGSMEFPSSHGWHYKMKKSVRKVCERMIRGDIGKNHELKTEKTNCSTY